MGQVFISYARVDREYVAHIAELLQRTGLKVWVDDRIEAGSHFDDVIEQALDEAEKVLVIWTAASVKSQWVRAEAGEGLQRGVLVPIIVDSAKIPLEFRRIQAIDFSAWGGGPEDAPFPALVRSLLRPSNAKGESSPSAVSSQPSTGPIQSPTSRGPSRSVPQKYLIGGAVLLSASIGLAMYLRTIADELKPEQRMTQYLESLPCSWLRVADHSTTDGREHFEFEGASVIPSEKLKGELTREARRSGLIVGGVRAAVAPVFEQHCALFDRLKPFSYKGVPRIEYKVVNAVLDNTSDLAGRPGTMAMLELDPSHLKRHYALLGIENDGDAYWLGDKSDLIANDWKGTDDKLQLQVDSDEAGWQGVILMESEKPIPKRVIEAAVSSSSTVADFENQALEAGWRFELIWYHAAPSKKAASAETFSQATE